MIADARCSLLLDAAQAALWEFDGATGLTSIHAGSDLSGAFAETTTVREAEWYGITHPEDLDAISALWLAVRRGDVSEYRCDWRVQGVDGLWHWVRSVGRATEHDALGRPQRIAGLYFDIGPLKAAEEARAASEAELVALLESAPHALLIVDGDFRAMHWNPLADRLIRQFVGRAPRAGDDATFYSPLGQPAVTRAYFERALSGESVSVERELQFGGNRSWVEFTARPLQPSGAGRRVVITARDVTAHGQVELNRAQAMKLESLGLLAGGVAHDFNNLLTAIIGNIELATVSGVTDPSIAESLGDALIAARRAAEVAGYLLEYAGRQPSRATAIDCGEIVHETARLLRKSLPANVRLVQGEGEAVPPVLADRTQLQQMLINLIVNARDAVGERGGAISVETQTVTITPALRSRALVANRGTAERYVSIVVEDDGAGMDRQTLARIFEPFFTTKEGGHGLGLASVLGAVRANNGMLLLDSWPGRGTRFEVLLPAISNSD